MGLHVGREFLPKPNRHMLQRVDPKGIDTGIQPFLNGTLDVIPKLNILLIKRCKPHHFTVNQLEFILPVGDLRVVIIKTIGVIIEISQWSPIVINHPFAAVDIGRAMVADHIKNELDSSSM